MCATFYCGYCVKISAINLVTLVITGGSQGYWECPKNVIKERIHKKLFCSFQNDDKNYGIVCLLQICGKMSVL